MTDKQYVLTPKLNKVVESRGTATSNAESRHAFIPIREKDGTTSIWQLPVNGDTEKRVLHFADRSRQLFRTTLDVDAKNFYFTLGDRESDIWTMELKRR